MRHEREDGKADDEENTEEENADEAEDADADGEETEEDKKTAEMLKKIDTWIHNFQNCEIKPGIITPGDDSLGRN